MERVLGKKEGVEINNSILASRIQTVADGLRDQENHEEAEKLFRKI